MSAQTFTHSSLTQIALVTAAIVLAYSQVIAQTTTAPITQTAWRTQLEQRLASDADGRMDVLVEFKTDAAIVRPVRERGAAVNNQERPLDAVRDTNQRLNRTLTERMQSAGINVLRTYDYVPVVLVNVSQDQIADLAAMSDVVSAEPDLLSRAQEIEDRGEPERALLSVSTDAIRAREAWARGFDGRNQVIAIMDTGINAAHEMFQNNKIVTEACFSGGGNGQTVCPGGVKQIRSQAGAASECTGGASICDHGTHVAGIAAGFTAPWTDNSRNTENIRLGVAPMAGLLPIQVFSRFTTGCTGSATTCLLTSTSDQLSALNYLLDVVNTGQLGPSRQLVAVNMSFGGDPDFSDYCYTNSLVSALRLLRQVGVLATVSSGNDSTNDRVSSPSCIKDVLTVDAANRTNTTGTSYSNSAPAVDIIAPGGSSGASIISAGIATPTSYVGKIGTSMAAPHVAGAVAVLRSRLPNASADQVEWAIKRSASRSSVFSQEFKRWTQYFLDVNAAIDVLGQPPALGIPVAGYFPNSYSGGFSYARIYNPTTSSGTVNLTLVRDDTGDVLGSTLRTIPARSAVQIPVVSLQATVGGVALDVPASTTLSVYFDASYLGYAQNVLWNATAQSLTNLTSCADNQPDFSYMLGNIHTDLISANYPSLIRIHNKSPMAARAVFDVYNSATGSFIGRWTTPDQILPQTTKTYAATTAFRDLGFTPDDSTFHTAFILRSDPNFVLGHIVNNAGANVMADMSPKCRI